MWLVWWTLHQSEPMSLPLRLEPGLLHTCHHQGNRSDWSPLLLAAVVCCDTHHAVASSWTQTLFKPSLTPLLPETSHITCPLSLRSVYLHCICLYSVKVTVTSWNCRPFTTAASYLTQLRHCETSLSSVWVVYILSDFNAAPHAVRLSPNKKKKKKES